MRRDGGFIVSLAAYPAVKCLTHQAANISELPIGSCTSLADSVSCFCRFKLSPNGE